MRRKWALSISATALLIFAPCTALAQEDARNVAVSERGQPEYDPLGLRFGGFQLHGSVEVGVDQTDNLFAAPTGFENEDVYLTVRPEARLSSNWSRHALQVAAGGSFREHQDFSSENTETVYLAVGGRLDIGRDTVIGADARASQEVESRTDPDSPVTVEPVEYAIRGASAYVGQRFNRIAVRLSGAYTEYDYDDAGDPALPGSDQDYRDREETDFSLRGSYDVTERLSVLAEARADRRAYYDGEVTPDSDGVAFVVGAAFEFTNLLRGEVTVGQFEREYEPTVAVPDVEEVSGAAIAGTVNWFVTPLTTVSFNVSRDAEESSFQNPYVQTYYAARVDHELRRNIILTAAAGRADNSYEGADREDEFTTYELGARYLMNRRVSFNGSYVHNDASSEGLDAFRSYDVDHFRVAVKFSL